MRRCHQVAIPTLRYPESSFELDLQAATQHSHPKHQHNVQRCRGVPHGLGVGLPSRLSLPDALPCSRLFVSTHFDLANSEESLTHDCLLVYLAKHANALASAYSLNSFTSSPLAFTAYDSFLGVYLIN
ncbi:unnamed protein product [Periconia digitata]|uniref:Uncharacterized protein n=1 Tax=Periconia digitata TaxID=1303443 RepID=A0A9W4XXE0_9PLEO|nr:unnamed protein product [Periconia digitata]